MGMCKPSGGIKIVTGKLGSLPRKGKPNTRTDLYNEKGDLIQNRWYGADGWVIHNRDHNHGDLCPHDHYWVLDIIKGPQRGKGHENIDNDFC